MSSLLVGDAVGVDRQPVSASAVVPDAEAAGIRVVAEARNSEVVPTGSGVVQVDGRRMTRDPALDLHAFTVARGHFQVQKLARSRGPDADVTSEIGRVGDAQGAVRLQAVRCGEMSTDLELNVVQPALAPPRAEGKLLRVPPPKQMRPRRDGDPYF